MLAKLIGGGDSKLGGVWVVGVGLAGRVGAGGAVWEGINSDGQRRTIWKSGCNADVRVVDARGARFGLAGLGYV